MATPNMMHDLTSALLAAATEAASIEAFDIAAMAEIRQATGANSVSLWQATLPTWSCLSSAGKIGRGPHETVIDALDQLTVCQAAGWTASCVPSITRPQPDILSLQANFDSQSAAEIAMTLGMVRALVTTRNLSEQRSERLDEMLAISIAWSETSDLNALLNRMAESASRLFKSDRATIFLWDRAASKLVGRPAMGLPDGLVVPDNAGVVGQVVQTGEPLRTSDQKDASTVDRATDESTGYQTDSLLCVPLDAPSGERLGAFELINKKGSQGTFTPEDEQGLAEFARLAAVALANAQQVGDLIERRDSLVDEAASDVRMLGESPAIVALRKTIDRVANADLAVLVLGENGTGKEVVSQSLHFQSGRRNEPLLAVNCAAIAESLLESELFGHEAGAFTDARDSRAGKFELADGGTLLLDEIGDMSPGGQAKLLRVLEDKTVVRVGGSEPRKVDVRVVAATNRDLSDWVRQGKFREDLYYRLNVVSLELPPLRERGDDIILLAEHFLSKFCHSQGRTPPKIGSEARRRLLSHNWPGNIRELRNLMERVAYLSEGNTVKQEDLAIVPSAGDRDPVLEYPDLLTEATKEFQREHIQRAVDRHRGNVAAAAAKLGMHRSNLYRKMKQLGMKNLEEDFI